MASDEVVHECPWCKGKGVVAMTGVYAETLKLLKRQRKEINGADLSRIAGVKGPAMNNRLARLGELGYATSRRNGREVLWKAV